MKTQTKAVLSTLVAAFSLASFAAEAATIRVQCEVRNNRAKVSVDGNGLAAGQYSAVVMSGTNTAQSGYAAAIGDEAEFDFDSDRGDIAQGATAIASNFIVGGVVTGKIVNAAGATVISDAVACRVKR
jgi:hypothetical protein